MLPASRSPRRFADGDQADRRDPDDHPFSRTSPGTPTRSARRPTTWRRRRSGRSRSSAPTRRSSADRPADVAPRDGVRAAAGRVGDADLAVADGDRDEQDAMAMLICEAVGERDDPAEDQDPQDLLGGVGRRADRVRAEDGEGLLLREPLAELLLAGQRSAEQVAAGVTRASARRAWSGRWRLPWPSACPCPCTGSTARAGARRGRACRRACGPGAVGGRRSSAAVDACGQTPWTAARPGGVGRPASRIAAATASMS